ncbi:DHA2 family efflux MFS transporter permease subunit [uncultured Jatrophihabitans sp.]|uniref:DHA2 family efflux MFS transporter permease subunit n=1 Tax=uncultured Jatrophihabitans sp. TaxID=1610747 RepID=UPI0035CAA5FD
MRATQRVWALVTVSLATFMTYVDNNIVNVAIPAIQRDLGLTTSGLEWVVSAYLLAFASLLLAGGRLGDVLGRRRLFVIGLTVFTLASLAAGLAGNVDVLVTSRAIQGIGAALVTPTTLSIITNVYPDAKERTAAIGIWSAVGALALAVGPLLGGLISQHLAWGWIFFINVPVGAATVVAGLWAIPADASVAARRSLDVPGIVLSAVGLLGLTYALIEGQGKGWTSAPIMTGFALAAGAFVLFTLVERTTKDPMVDVRLFTDRVFTGGITAIVMWGFGLFGIYFFTSLYLQGVLGFSPTEAGAAFVPMALLMATGAVLADRISARIGAHRSAGLAMLLMAAGIASVTLLGEGSSYLSLMPSFALIGVGGGLSVPLTAMIIGTMPVAQAGVASGIFNAAREVAGLLGITVIGAILINRQTAALHAGHTVTASFLSGYRWGLVVAAILVAAGGVAAYFALRNTTPNPALAAEPELVLA